MNIIKDSKKQIIRQSDKPSQISPTKETLKLLNIMIEDIDELEHSAISFTNGEIFTQKLMNKIGSFPLEQIFK